MFIACFALVVAVYVLAKGCEKFVQQRRERAANNHGVKGGKSRMQGAIMTGHTEGGVTETVAGAVSGVAPTVGMVHSAMKGTGNEPVQNRLAQVGLDFAERFGGFGTEVTLGVPRTAATDIVAQQVAAAAGLERMGACPPGQSVQYTIEGSPECAEHMAAEASDSLLAKRLGIEHARFATRGGGDQAYLLMPDGSVAGNGAQAMPIERMCAGGNFGPDGSCLEFYGSSMEGSERIFERMNGNGSVYKDTTTDGNTKVTVNPYVRSEGHGITWANPGAAVNPIAVDGNISGLVGHFNGNRRREHMDSGLTCSYPRIDPNYPTHAAAAEVYIHFQGTDADCYGTDNTTTGRDDAKMAMGLPGQVIESNLEATGYIEKSLKVGRPVRIFGGGVDVVLNTMADWDVYRAGAEHMANPFKASGFVDRIADKLDALMPGVRGQSLMGFAGNVEDFDLSRSAQITTSRSRSGRGNF